MNARDPYDVPRGLRFSNPPIVWARRHRDGPWLAIKQFTRVESFEDAWVSREYYCELYWYPRASHINCRPYLEGRDYDTLLEAIEDAEFLLRRDAPAYVKVRKPTRIDFQRSRVYRWEERNLLAAARWPIMELHECYDLMVRVFTDRDKPVPKLNDGRGRRVACATWNKIYLPRWSRIAPIVLHECAHVLSPRDAGHGPEFMRIYVDLLKTYCKYSRRSLVDTALTSGIKIQGENA